MGTLHRAVRHVVRDTDRGSAWEAAFEALKRDARPRAAARGWCRWRDDRAAAMAAALVQLGAARQALE